MITGKAYETVPCILVEAHAPVSEGRNSVMGRISYVLGKNESSLLDLLDQDNRKRNIIAFFFKTCVM